MTIIHENPHNLKVVCDSCKLPIFDGDMDDGAPQLRMIHTHCAPCCDSIAESHDSITKSLNETLHMLLKAKDKAYKDLAEGKESTLEDRIQWLKITLKMYEEDAKEGRG